MAGSKLKRFLLLYASQTGQAKAIAEEIAENAGNHGLEAEVHCLSLTEKKFWLEKEQLVVIITSTTGDGDPPDTAGKFYRRLKKKTLPSDHLSQLKFSLLGLGDTNYSNFCNCGKMMNARLLELGAKHFHDPGFADDATGLEIVVEPWIEGLWVPLKEQVAQLEDSIVNGCDSNSATSVIENSENITCDTTDSARNITDLRPAQNSVLNGGTSIMVDSNLANVDGSPQITEQITKQTDARSSNGMTKIDSEKEISNNSEGSKVAENSPEVESLTRSLPLLSDSALNLPALPPTYISMTFQPETSLDLSVIPIQNGCAFPSAKSEVTMATVVSVNQLTTDGAVKRTLCVTLDISDCGWGYEPGDSFGIVCQNSHEEVEQLISRVGLTEAADQPYNLDIIAGTKKKNPSVPDYIPQSATLRHVLTHCCDIRSVPKKAFLRRLIEHTSDPGEKRRLQELCSRQGSAHFAAYIRDQGLGLLDILHAFPSCLPPPATLIEHLPRLQARPYSASSCLQSTLGRLSCAFNIIDIPAGNGRSYGRAGVCTGWMDRITKGIQRKDGDSMEESVAALRLEERPKIPIYLRSNQNFRLPEDTNKPIVMVGPGTGVAPFIGFLQKREFLKAQGADLAESWLFYGCRHRSKDFLFKEEMERFREAGVLSHLCVCFSREEEEEESGQPKYVQDNIRRNADALVKLIEEQEAIVYVCGDAKGMAKDVSQAFIDILSQVKGVDTKDAEGIIMQKRLHKTYLEDVWT